VLSPVTTAATSQLPKDPCTYRRTKRGQNTKVPQSGGSPNKVTDETINEEMLDSVERASTIATSLEAKQASGTIHKTQFMATLNEPFSLELGLGGRTLGSGEDSMEHQIELTDNVPNTPHDSPLPGGYTPGSDKGRLKLEELMAIGDTEVLDTEKAVNTAGEEVSTAALRTPPTTTTIFDDEDVTMAMAQTLINMKEGKAKEKGVAIKDVEDSSRPIRSITTLQPLPTINPKDKGKGILQETKPVEKTKEKVQGDAQMKKMNYG
ncbi:hypothetical protein Tco_1495039, partial [Tanacetum coccineum]